MIRIPLTHALCTLALISLPAARPREDRRIPPTIASRTDTARGLALPAAEG